MGKGANLQTDEALAPFAPGGLDDLISTGSTGSTGSSTGGFSDN
ncbi:hypothetical protein PIIN_00964 [Serendipita indica DSM 11827]|uniref:Uncharacterized protein n=1 Tax=Serendipita indica (strain DSM 11827) TaxID=1109443 RepID=G4T797_SERID|nr:hypothetical protein PIIN_00964 [Serendipita indica DSM 11827]